jgi:hypothetical protein
MKYKKKRLKKINCKGCDTKFKQRSAIQKYCTKKCCDNHLNRKRFRKEGGIGDTPNQEELVFANYKEPLREFKKGYGYEGVLLMSPDKTKIQCHLCGRMFKGLAGHLTACHDMDTHKYKEITKLQTSTALVGEATREKLIKNYLKVEHIVSPKRNGNRKKQWKNVTKANTARKGTKMRLELKNKRGSCPDQLLDKIKKVAEELGHTPSVKEFRRINGTRFVGTIYETFGSWPNALKMLGMKSKKEIRKEKYSPKMLKKYMVDFYKKHKRPPLNSDLERGLLPSPGVYRRVWGTLSAARQAAGIPDVIPVGKRKFVIVDPMKPSNL